MIEFIDAETGSHIYVNPDHVQLIRETRLGSRYVTRIGFIDDTYVLVGDVPKSCAEKLSKKTSK